MKSEQDADRYVKVYMPSREELKRFAGKSITEDQYEDALRYIEKGIEAQLDWHILKTCALQEIGVM